MIKINLLPVREERRRLGAKQEQMFFALIMVLVFIGIYYWHSSLNRKIDSLESQNNRVKQEIQRLDKIVKEVEKYKSDKKVLEGKISVIDQLKTYRQVQVHYLDELNKALPSQIWLDYYQQRGENLVLRGKSLATEDIAAFMRNLEASDYFEDIRLDQTSQQEFEIGDRTMRVSNFSLRLMVVQKAGKGNNPT